MFAADDSLDQTYKIKMHRPALTCLLPMPAWIKRIE